MAVSAELGQFERGPKPIPEWLPQELSHAYLLAAMLKYEWIGERMERLGRYGAREVRGLEHAQKAADLISEGNRVFVPMAPHRAGFDGPAAIVMLNELIMKKANLGAEKMAVFPSGKYLTRDEGRFEEVPGIEFLTGRGYRSMRERMGFPQFPLYQDYLMEGLAEEEQEKIRAYNNEQVNLAVQSLGRGDTSLALIYPEGHRNKTLEMMRWLPGVGVMPQRVERLLDAKKQVWVAPLVFRGMQNFSQKWGKLQVPYLDLNRGFEAEFLPPVPLVELKRWKQVVGWSDDVEGKMGGFRMADMMAVYAIHMCKSGLSASETGIYAKENLKFK